MREGLSGVPCIPKKEKGAQSHVGVVGLIDPQCLSTPSARDRDLLGVPLPLSGRGRGTVRRADKGQNRQIDTENRRIGRARRRGSACSAGLVRGPWEVRSTEHADQVIRKNLFLNCSVCSVLRMSQENAEQVRSRGGPMLPA